MRVVLIAAFLVSTPLYATIYTCKTAAGKTAFLSSPCPEGAEQTSIIESEPQASHIRRPRLADHIDQQLERRNESLVVPIPAATTRVSDPFAFPSGMQVTDPFARQSSAEGPDPFATASSGPLAIRPAADSTPERVEPSALSRSITHGLGAGILSFFIFVVWALFKHFAASKKAIARGLATTSYEVTHFLPVIFSAIIGLAVLAVPVWFVWWLFFAPHSIEYYWANDEARTERIRACASDVSKDADCKNAIAAARTLLLRHR